MKKTEVAWAAGFFDGEGCTSLGPSGKVHVSIGQKEDSTLRRFLTAIELGYKKVYGPTTNGMYQIQLNGAHALLVLDELWPYLSNPKKQQAISKGYIPNSYSNRITFDKEIKM